MSDLSDTYLGQFQLIEVIRRGGMSTVYKAYQASLDRYVAVKVLLQINDPQFGARFAREARAIAQLQHHNILPIYDYGEQDGLSYLVLQYIENGVTLADMLGAPLPPTQALRLTNQLLMALDYAHSRGIVHRDIKPANILMPWPNWVMLADFGIAKLMDDGKNLTSPGLIVGTAAYMAPEQAAGQPIDARTDLYAAGIMLYEMVTGQVPFDADTPVAMLTKHAYEPPPPPRSRNPDLPELLEIALLRALAKVPDERYQSAADMMAALELVLAQIELPDTRGQLAGLYQAGLRAIETGRWDLAVERLGQLVALDPSYEDAVDLLEVAYTAQDRVRAEARQQIALVRQRRQSAIYPQIQSPDATAPDVQPEPDACSGAAAPVAMSVARNALDDPRQSLPLARRPRGRLLGAIVAVVALALLLVASRVAGLWPGQAAPAIPAGNPAPTALAATTAGTAPTLAASAAAPSAPEPLGKLVYQDDFSAGASTSWLEDLVNATDFSRGFHPPGLYHIRLSQPNETRRVLLPRFAFHDFSLQIDLWDESDDFVGDVTHGVIFRARDADHFYALLISPRSGRYSIRKYAGQDTSTDLIAWKDSALIKRRAEVNQLRVDATGGAFTIYLNGALLDRFSDDAYAGLGMVGLIAANRDASGSHLHFDNIAIRSSDTALRSELPTLRADRAGEMVLIPGGEFVLGGNERSDAPAHMVALPDFYLDRTEVTNAVYMQCVEAGQCAPPQAPDSVTRQNYATLDRFADYPAIYVSWEQARSFCTWAGKRLPSEAEWEKAASWSSMTHEKSIYPSGNQFDPLLLNSKESNRGDTTAVGQFAAELNGTRDMAGNVSEWTNSLYFPYPYLEFDGREENPAPGERVLRGGSWGQTQGKARSFGRQPAQPAYADGEIGFRCAVTPYSGEQND